MRSCIKAGVLALQGAFKEHIGVMSRLGAECVELRGSEDLSTDLDCLILPGGESTVQCRLLRELGMYERLRDMILDGIPVYGTCAGMILLAKHVVNDAPDTLGLMDITVLRNAYGRQSGQLFHIRQLWRVRQGGHAVHTRPIYSLITEKTCCLSHSPAANVPLRARKTCWSHRFILS